MVSEFKYQCPELKNGYTKIAGPGSTKLRYIEFGIIKLAKNGEWCGKSGNRETVFLLQHGSASITVSPAGSESVTYTVGPREDIFTQKCSLVYVPAESGYIIKTSGKSVLGLLIDVPALSVGVPFHVTPDMVKTNSVGRENWHRTVCLATVPQCRAQRLLVGETFNPPGNWSSYPPHKHDEHIPGKEVPLEEIYHYRFKPEKGFALQRIYDPPGNTELLDEVMMVNDRDTAIIPGGYHPLVAAPGYSLCYTWILAGDILEYGAWSNDPQHEWLMKK